MKPVISKEVVVPLRDYCRKRHYRCRNCRYSIDRITKNHSEYMQCIFANMPCDWTEEGKDEHNN